MLCWLCQSMCSNVVCPVFGHNDIWVPPSTVVTILWVHDITFIDKVKLWHNEDSKILKPLCNYLNKYSKALHIHSRAPKLTWRKWPPKSELGLLDWPPPLPPCVLAFAGVYLLVNGKPSKNIFNSKLGVELPGPIIGSTSLKFQQGFNCLNFWPWIATKNYESMEY